METFAKPVKAFVVAGGHEGSHTSSSVLMLLHGASSWTPVASLPGILYQARASVVGGNMRVTGGRPGPPGGNTEVRVGELCLHLRPFQFLSFLVP